MKTIAIVFLSLIAACLILLLFPLVLPVLLGGFALVLAFFLVIAIGTGVVSMAAGVAAKATIGVASISATIIAMMLLPLFLLGAITFAFCSRFL